MPHFRPPPPAVAAPKPHCQDMSHDSSPLILARSAERIAANPARGRRGTHRRLDSRHRERATRRPPCSRDLPDHAFRAWRVRRTAGQTASSCALRPSAFRLNIRSSRVGVAASVRSEPAGASFADELARHALLFQRSSRPRHGPAGGGRARRCRRRAGTGPRRLPRFARRHRPGPVAVRRDVPVAAGSARQRRVPRRTAVRLALRGARCARRCRPDDGAAHRHGESGRRAAARVGDDKWRRLHGFADVSLGAQWRVRGGDAGWLPGVAWLADVETTMGSPAFRDRNVRPSLRATAQWELPQDMTLGVMPGLYRDRGDDGHHYAAGVMAVTLGKSWTPRLQSFVELAGQRLSRSQAGRVAAQRRHRRRLRRVEDAAGGHGGVAQPVRQRVATGARRAEPVVAVLSPRNKVQRGRVAQRARGRAAALRSRGVNYCAGIAPANDAQAPCASASRPLSDGALDACATGGRVTSRNVTRRTAPESAGSCVDAFRDGPARSLHS